MARIVIEYKFVENFHATSLGVTENNYHSFLLSFYYNVDLSTKRFLSILKTSHS